MKKNIYLISIISAGFLWGFMGFFRRTLGDIGFSASDIIFIRCCFSALLYAATIAITKPSDLKICIKDVWCFIGSGIVSLLFFSLCYFQAMTLMSLSAAAILLYTAPAFVIILSAVIFRERITAKKLAALFLAFAGCCFTSGIVGSDFRICTAGILYGLGSGLGYALYSIFGRFAINRGYSSNTISLWSCLFAAAGCSVLFGVKAPLTIVFSSGNVFLFCLLTAIITTYLPYMLYTFGLTGIDSGTASVVASIEPVVATGVGIILYHETLNIWSVSGIVLVLSAIVLLNTNYRK